MKINEVDYSFKGTLADRVKTLYLILHHRAGTGDAKSIHASHLALGYQGIGYHFYVRKDGSIFRGRPETKIGAHAKGFNDKSLGICFEGNFESEKMPEIQLSAGRKLIKYLKSIYPDAVVKRHKDFNQTACPGKNFPFDEMTKTDLTSANDITWELDHSYFEILDKEKFIAELDGAKKKNSSLYWGYYKLVNKGERKNG